MPENETEPTAELLKIPADGLRKADPGTIERHYGFDFTVQDDNSRIGEIPGYAVADQIAAGRMFRLEPGADPKVNLGAAANGGAGGASQPNALVALAVDDSLAVLMRDAGFVTVEAVAASDPTVLSGVKGIGKKRAAGLIATANEILATAKAAAESASEGGAGSAQGQ